MSDKLKFSLGGAEYEVPRLKLRQVRDLQLTAARYQEKPEAMEERITQTYEAGMRILVIALSGHHPEVSLDALWEVATTKEEIWAIATEILKFSGLVPPGEAGAAKE